VRHLAVLPAFNEEKSIGMVIGEIRKAIPTADILVVNDGSEDRTGPISSGEGAVVVSHPFNLGYGAALQTGFRFATKKGYDYVFTIDADGQHIPSSAQGLLDAMRDQAADVVIGSRFIGGSYRVSVAKKIGIRLFSLIAKTYTGINITDPTSGFQLLNRKAFSYLAEGDNYPLDYPDVNIIMGLHKRKFKIVETSVEMIENREGRSMHSGLRPISYVVKMFLAIIMVLVRGTRKK
jgi:glycosyltransferase involved in cell wall biosynthesis